jgi:mRNA interferase MazF
VGTFTKGDIVLFPFPYTDLSNRKLRPCLVISDKMGEDILLCQITSQRIRKDKYCVEIKQNNTIDGSLQIDSYIRANMIFTASRAQILKKICMIRDKQYTEVVNIINNFIRK